MINPTAAPTFLLIFVAAAFGQQQHNPEYVYIPIGSGEVDAFAVNQTSGALTALPGSPFTLPGSVFTVDPAGRFLFAGNAFSSKGISVYKIDRGTGALTVVPGSPFAPTLPIADLVVNPGGRFLFVATQAYIVPYSIDGNTGAITPAALGTFVYGSIFAISPNGKFLYLSSLPPLPLDSYSINQQTGALTLLPYGTEGASPVISADGKYLYTIDNLTQPRSSSVYVNSLDPDSGAITPIPGSPFSVPHTIKYSLALDPTGRFLYEGLYGPKNSYGIAGLAINSVTGGIDGPVPGSPFATIGYPVGLVIDPAGRFVYTADCCQYVASEFTLNQTTGNLSPLSGPALPMASSTQTIVLANPKPLSPASLVSLTIQPVNLTVLAYVSPDQFTASGTYSDGTHRFLTASVTWSTSNPGVATISNAPGSSGLASVVGAGQTQIGATLGNLSATTTLTVQPSALISIAVTPNNPMARAGTTLQFTAIGTYQDGTMKVLTDSAKWLSSNVPVASVTQGGLTTGESVGTCIISAVLEGITGDTVLTVSPAAAI
jgi:6-phosphogluconolactonase (cycloisomerase 2 family)